MRLKLLGLWAFFFAASPVMAQEFFIKTEGRGIDRINLDFEMSEKREIRFENPDHLKAFLMNDKRIPSSWVSARDASDVEKVVDAGFMILTGFMMISTHDSYELNSELRLSSIRGVFFFLFPFEDHYLYARCKNEEHLVATSAKPTDDTLKRMKTLSEVQKLCGVKDDSNKDPS